MYLVLVLATTGALILGAIMFFQGRRMRGFAALAAATLLTLLTLLQPRVTTRSAPLSAALPPRQPHDGYVTSDACQRCHPDQHASWRQTYHRTMTQAATPENVLAPFDDTRLDADGHVSRVFRRGDQFWVETDDPEWERMTFLANQDTRDAATRPRVQSRIVMTTGSHHFQVYWIRSRYGRELWQFPWRYDLLRRQWVHRRDAFLGPPQWRPGMRFKVWNDNCIICHSTGGRPGREPSTNYMEHTVVAELGIACEACHGPGKSHVAKHDGQLSEPRPVAASIDETIVNPAKLDHERSSEICGQCHSNFIHESPDLLVNGVPFRPGGRLTEFGRFFRPESEASEDVESRFWADGVNRSTGREFMGVKESPCYRRGDMSCLSCHGMHDSDPNDQLIAGMDTNAACYQCHAEYEERLSAHTHHAADSTGSLCYNCHMPHTNYALLKATRSHQITNPTVTAIEHKSRPNACNLCHLDKSLAWTASQLTDWYGQPAVELNEAEKDVSAWALWMLRGDAGQRVVSAWHAGWPAAQEASGKEWLTPVVLPLLIDPYSVVRSVSRTSLKSLTGSDPTIPESLATDGPWLEQALGEWWREASEPPRSRLNEILAIDPASENLETSVKAILRRRDDKPIASVE